MYRDILDIVIAFVAAYLFYQFLIIVTGTPLPIVSVVSDSMEPVLHRGDLLFVTGGNYNVGDVAIYEKPAVGYTIVHRVIEKNNNTYVFKGDNNMAPDPRPVSKQEIKGKVRFAVPLLGYPRLTLMLFGI